VPVLRELRGALTAFCVVVCGALVLVSFDLGIPGQVVLQSLRFHVAAVLFGLAVLLFVTRAWWRGMLFLVAFSLSAGQGALVIYRQQEARATFASQPNRPLFKMLSFNLLQTNRENGHKIAQFIENSGADLVLVMEAGPVGPFAEEIAAIYPYRSDCPPKEACEMYLLSRTPLSHLQVGNLSTVWTNRLITARTEIGGQTITIVAAHRIKPYFDEFPDEETWRLDRVLKAIEGPLVLAGDFNAAAWSVSIDRLNRVSGLIPGPSYPATWPVPLGPLGVPIDNMWTRGPLFISSIHALDDAMGSNHRGIFAEVSVTGPPATAP